MPDGNKLTSKPDKTHPENYRTGRSGTQFADWTVVRRWRLATPVPIRSSWSLGQASQFGSCESAPRERVPAWRKLRDRRLSSGPLAWNRELTRRHLKHWDLQAL